MFKFLTNIYGNKSKPQIAELEEKIQNLEDQVASCAYLYITTRDKINVTCKRCALFRENRKCKTDECANKQNNITYFDAHAQWTEVQKMLTRAQKQLQRAQRGA